ncbi:hypothetical protein [Maricaulis maris]|uniref:hypothetical protein n=1 Tax=Maricaulis maris TaxID=74318 RepID=UPI003B8DA9AA
MIRLLALAWTLLSVVLAVWVGWLFATLHWGNRGCFDENGRCFADGVVHHDVTVIYFLMAVLSIISALGGLVLAIRLRRSGS